MTRVIKGLVTSSVEKMRASTRAVVSLFVLNSLEYCNCVPIGVEYDEYMNSPVRPVSKSRENQSRCDRGKDTPRERGERERGEWDEKATEREEKEKRERR
eukprot:1325229-Amorphochlora_amoeboformis.AAC.1